MKRQNPSSILSYFSTKKGHVDREEASTSEASDCESDPDTPENTECGTE